MAIIYDYTHIYRATCDKYNGELSVYSNAGCTAKTQTLISYSTACEYFDNPEGDSNTFRYFRRVNFIFKIIFTAHQKPCIWTVGRMLCGRCRHPSPNTLSNIDANKISHDRSEQSTCDRSTNFIASDTRSVSDTISSTHEESNCACANSITDSETN